LAGGISKSTFVIFEFSSNLKRGSAAARAMSPTLVWTFAQSLRVISSICVSSTVPFYILLITSPRGVTDGKEDKACLSARDARGESASHEEEKSPVFIVLVSSS